jgi:hypothetical protein
LKTNTIRTPQEILTKYKFGGVTHEHCKWSWFYCVWEHCRVKLNVGPLQDAATTAAHAKGKLMRRQEKLEVK